MKTSETQFEFSANFVRRNLAIGEPKAMTEPSEPNFLIKQEEYNYGKKKNRSRQLENEHDSKPGCKISRRIKTIGRI